MDRMVKMEVQELPDQLEHLDPLEPPVQRELPEQVEQVNKNFFFK